MPFITQGKTSWILFAIVVVAIVILFLIIKFYAFSNSSLSRNECFAKKGTIRTQNIDLPDFLKRFFTCKLWEIDIGRVWDVNCICSCCKPLF